MLFILFCVNFLFQQVSADIPNNHVWTLKLIDLAKYPNARCLDGTPGGFWYQNGYGDGVNKFIIHHQGGGWCVDVHSCYSRSLSPLGSSSTWEKISDCASGSQAQPCQTDYGHGIFGLDPNLNPISYNWNQFYFGYCDGSSSSGHVIEPVSVPGKSNDTLLYFKGRYILDAIYETILADYGMNQAKEVIISGSSAGGLSVYVHIEYLHSKILQSQLNSSSKPRILGVPDAGYFLDFPSFLQTTDQVTRYQTIFQVQNLSDSISDACITHYSSSFEGVDERWKCLFPQYLLPFITLTPLFLVNSMIDSWQVPSFMKIHCDPSKWSFSLTTMGGWSLIKVLSPTWSLIKTFLPSSLIKVITVGNYCSQEEINFMNAWREKMLQPDDSALIQFLYQGDDNSNKKQKSRKHGAWFCTCFQHCLVNHDGYWSKVIVQGQTLRDTFLYWYQHLDVEGEVEDDRLTTTAASAIVFDGPIGHNPTCQYANYDDEDDRGFGHSLWQLFKKNWNGLLAYLKEHWR